jgi:hypothetical protein
MFSIPISVPSWTEFRLACRGVLLFFLPYELLSTYLLVKPPSGIERFLTADVVGYAFGWILFPMVLLTLERPLEREREMPGCIAVLNWLTLLPAMLQLPVMLVAMLDAGPGLINGLSILDALLNIALGHLVFALAYTPGAAIS